MLRTAPSTTRATVSWRRPRGRTILGIAMFGASLLAGSSIRLEVPADPVSRIAAASVPGRSSSMALAADMRLVWDPKSALPAASLTFGANPPLAMVLQPAVPAPGRALASNEAAPAEPALSRLSLAFRAEAAGTGLRPALPVSRTVRLARGTRVATRLKPGRSRLGALRDADRGAAMQRLFGPQSVSGPPLAYATLPSNPVDAVPAERPSAVPPAAAAGIAIYDISARTVTLPSGERLEAHSGLGATLDDPRYVHLRMRGATPPGTYDLRLRESLFHGVKALRLNPVGGAGAIHGRAGLLAHTFMLGPNGDSNGCVSFRHYDRFLQAYLRGEITRLVVVAGQSDGFQGLARRLFGARGMSDRGV